MTRPVHVQLHGSTKFNENTSSGRLTDGQTDILTDASHLGQDTAVGTVTRIRARRCGVRIPVGIGDFSLHQDVQTDSCASYKMGTGVLTRR